MPKKKRQRREKIPLPDGLNIGALVLYYSDVGWRAGYLMDVRSAGHEVGIKPVGGYKKSVHNLTWKKVGDVKPAEGKDEGTRTVYTKVRRRNRRV